MLFSIFTDVIHHYSCDIQNRIQPSVGTKLQQICPTLREVVASNSFYALHALWSNLQFVETRLP